MGCFVMHCTLDFCPNQPQRIKYTVASPTSPTWTLPSPFYLSVIVWPDSPRSGRLLYILMSTSNIFSLLLALNSSTSIHWVKRVSTLFLHFTVPPSCRRPPTSAVVPTTSADVLRCFHLFVIDFLSGNFVPLNYLVIRSYVKAEGVWNYLLG